MRRRYIYDFKTGNMVEVEYVSRETVAPEIMPDIKPYRSMADGSVVESRAKHREMLKRNGCFEVGEVPKAPKGIPDVAPEHRKELIVAQIQELGHDGFKKAIKRDIDAVKWNSNGLSRSE